jgi:hypothetical protein
MKGSGGDSLGPLEPTTNRWQKIFLFSLYFAPALEQSAGMNSTTSQEKHVQQSGSQHTPGPWIVINDGQQWPHVVAEYIPDGTICSMDATDPQHEGDDARAFDRLLANARLIAAAPELLARLRMAESYFARMDTTADFYLSAEFTLLKEFRAAIAKAEGRA